MRKESRKGRRQRKEERNMGGKLRRGNEGIEGVNLTKKKSEFIIKFLSLLHLKSTYRHSSPSSMQDVSHMKLV